MEKICITIGREFGSGGHEIGKKLAEKLGFGFYDKALLSKTAKESGLHEDYIKEHDEVFSPISFSVPLMDSNFYFVTNEDRMHIAMRKVINDIVEDESCIIIGRSADYELESKHIIKVFLYAPLEDRVYRKLLQIPEEERPEYTKMLRRVKFVDKQRRKYYEYFTDRKWGGMRNYDICLNTSITGIDGAVDLLESLAKKASQ